MAFAILDAGESRSFPADDPIRAPAVSAADADIVLALGGASLRDLTKRAILIELGERYLADEIGLVEDEAARNVVGFTRYRNGDDPPSRLVELVVASWTAPEAVAAAREAIADAGLVPVVSSDQPGRIIDRLVRPKYNAALRFLDEGLAAQADLDLTCRMGLGYPDGPLERVMRGGLEHHYEITRALFETFGTPAYAPPRAAVVAGRRRK